MEYTKGEQVVRDKIRDMLALHRAAILSAPYADAVMKIPEIKAASAMYEALEGIMADLENIVKPYILEQTIEALALARRE
ncbi:hypothetical protein LCGC14_0543660 [marine sediment metagenome]|uniref:Uncharacterized protein n=1 Tax=marine sediment metagenome TaxID=412755 RepID=A0A0F9SAJ0_9ZZZZ